jgi:hypothetical protein
MPINNQQMGLAMQAWQGMTPEQQQANKPQMRQMMDEYKAQQQEAWSRARSYYTAEDHGLGKERYDQLVGKLSSTLEPMKARQSLFNDELISLYAGQPSNQLNAKRTGFMQAIAEKEFGHTGPIDDAAFFSGMQGLYKMEDEMHAKVFEGAVAGQSAGAIWQGLSQANAGKPGWKQKERDYAKRVYLQAHELKTMADRLRPVANRVAGYLEGSQTNEDLSPALDEVRDLDDRQLAMVYMLMKGQGQKVDGGYDETVGEAGRRGLTDIYRTFAPYVDRRNLDALSQGLRAGAEIPEDAETPQEIVDGWSLLQKTRLSEAPDSMTGFQPEKTEFKTKKLTPEKEKEVTAYIDEKRKDLRLLTKLREFEETEMSPIEGQNFYTKYFAIPAAQSLGVMAVASVPYAGLVANALYYEDKEYNRLRDLGATHEQASRSALPVGIAQSAAERIQARFLIGKMPGTKAVLDRILGPGGNIGVRAAGNLVSNVAGETSVELFQDFIIPAAIQDITKAGGDVEWLGPEGTLQTAYRAAPETAAAVFLFGLFGTGMASLKDIQGGDRMVKDRNILLQSKFSESQADEILAIQDPQQALAKVQELWSKRNGTRESMVAAAKAAKTDAQTSQSAEQTLEQLGLIPIMGRDTQTGQWYVREKDGSIMPHGSYDEAHAARWQEIEDRKLGMHQAIREALEMDERKLQPGEETGPRFTFREIEAETQAREQPGDAKTLERRKKQSDILDDGYEREAYMASQAVNQATAVNAADREAVDLVLARSYTEFADGVRRNVMELNQGANPLTVVEDSVEGDARTLISGGKRDWLLSNLRELEQKTGEKLFITKDDAQVEASDIVEAYSHVATSYFAGKSRKGEGKFKNNKGWLDEFRAELRTMGIKRLLDATATKLYAMFRRAAKLMRLSQKGGINPEFEAQLAKSLGLEQALHEAGVVTESESLLKEMEPSFSIQRMATNSGAAQGAEGSPRGGPSLRMLHKSIQTAHGSRYYDFDSGDQWFHARIADHKNRTENREQKAYTAQVRESVIRPASTSGMHNPHTLNIVLPEPVSNEGQSQAMLKEALSLLPSGWMKPENIGGQLWGQEVTLELDGDTWELTNEETMERKSQSRAKSSFDVLGSGQSSLATSKTGGSTQPASSNTVNPENRAPSGSASYSLAPGKGTLDQRLAKMFDPFQKSPELRQKVGLLAQQRLAQFSQQWDSASKRRELEAGRLTSREDDLVERIKELEANHDWRVAEMRAAHEKVTDLAATEADERSKELRQTLEDAQDALKTAQEEKRLSLGGAAAEGLTGDSLRLERERLNHEITKLKQGVERAKSELEAHERKAEADLKALEKSQATERDTLVQRQRLERERLKGNVRGSIANDRRQTEASSAKASLLASLRTLDAILSALPAEVRGKIGGYVKLAELSTDEARLQEIEKRVERMDRELEKWLRKDIREQIEDLFEKAKPKKDKAGKTPKGKLGADGHHIFQQAEIAASADAATVQAMIAALDARLADPNITSEQEVLLEREREIVALVGDMKNAEAGRLAAAYTALNEFFQESWSKWKVEQTAKKERRKLDREELQTDTGSDGARAARTERRTETATLFGKIKGWATDLSSSVEVMRVAFGADSKVATRIADAERNASNQYEDAIQDTAQEVQDLFTQLAGGNVLKGEQLRFDMSRPSITAKGDKFSQLEAITAILLERQEDGRRHLRGPIDENGKPVGKWHYDQAFIDELDNALTPEARQVMSWLVTKYGGEYDTLNPLYRARHGVDLPKNANYSPITVKPMQTQSGEVVDPVTGVAASAGGIFTPGSLRTRSRVAIAEPDFRDALQTFLAHNKQMEWWKAYYDLAVDARAVMGNREVMNSVEAAVGEEGSRVLGKWLDVFATGGTRDAASGLLATNAMRRLASRAATVALLGRVSTLLVQSTQLAAASVKMPVGAYLKRFGKLMAGQLSWSDAIKSDFIQRRIKTAPPIVRQAMEGLGEASRPNQITRAVRFLGNLLSGADGLFTGGTYAILLDYHREMGAKMGMKGQELETYAHTEAQKATEDVAQPVRMGMRSIMEVTHTNPLAKMMWSYASEARQKIALAGWGALNWKKDKTYAAKAAFLTFIVGGLMSQVLKNVWRELKGDDDEEKWSPERLAFSTAFGPLHGIPLASQAIEGRGPLSSLQWTGAAVDRLAEGDYDSPTDLMRDIDTILSAAGHFNDNAAGIAALSHLGLDFAKLLENTGEELSGN